MASDIQTEFLCRCGKQKGWIGEGITTNPCPSCGRVYVGREQLNKHTGITEILADEVLFDNNAPTPR